MSPRSYVGSSIKETTQRPNHGEKKCLTVIFMEIFIKFRNFVKDNAYEKCIEQNTSRIFIVS